MQTLIRDKQGRFTTSSKVRTSNRELAERLGLVKRRPVRAWLSHNRWTILGYTGYVILCFATGAFGGYLGVRLSGIK